MTFSLGKRFLVVGSDNIVFKKKSNLTILREISNSRSKAVFIPEWGFWIQKVRGILSWFKNRCCVVGF